MIEGERIAFRMQLHPGQRDTYKARHDAIWTELADLLRAEGVIDHGIFLHEPNGALFAVLTRIQDHTMDRLPTHEIMQRWWRLMADIMDTGADGAPVAEPFEPMFHLP